MNNDDKLIKVISDILYPKFRERHVNVGGAIDESNGTAKEIIALVLDKLVANHVLVPDGLYKQMRFESDQFRVEHPSAYFNSHKEQEI